MTSARAATFDALYSADPDPWRFASSDYERLKRTATLNALSRNHYPRALEVGCSIGNLAEMLAARCGSLLAIDVSEVALSEAQVRGQAGNVTYQRAEIPQDWPRGTYDLIVFSEVLYFLDAREVRQSAALAASNLSQGGTILLVNWIGPTDTALNGDEAVDIFLAEAFPEGFHATYHRRDDGYRIDVLQSRQSEC